MIVMNKLEIGMYVRTKCGIAKITDIICGQDAKFDNDSIFEDDDLKQHHRYDGISTNDYFFKHDVVKISHNIIDILDVGDYVNGYEVTSKDQFLGFGNHDWYMTNDEIKSIVTKEAFKSMEYKVESEVK